MRTAVLIPSHMVLLPFRSAPGSLGRGMVRCAACCGHIRDARAWQHCYWAVLPIVAITLVAYRMVDGAIPEPLTDQPGDPERAGTASSWIAMAAIASICHAMPLPQRQFHGTVGPPLDGVGSRSSAGELRLRLVDPKAINPETIMPAYYKVEGSPSCP